MELEQLIEEFGSAFGPERTQASGGVWRFSAYGHVFGVTADDAGENAFLFGEALAPPCPA